MIAVDTNVLVYAHRLDEPLHGRAYGVVKDLAEGAARWAIPWPCVHEFYAVVTNVRLRSDPTSPARAWEQIDTWLESPTLELLCEAHSHLDRLRELSLGSQITGGQVHDARIAAICLSHGITELVTMDRDFARYPALRTRSLLA